MSFVWWVTVLALLAVGLGGIYGGVLSLTRRRLDLGYVVVEGRGRLLLGALYLVGGVVALMALVALVLLMP